MGRLEMEMGYRVRCGELAADAMSLRRRRLYAAYHLAGLMMT
jgi:hypothetical protein